MSSDNIPGYLSLNDVDLSVGCREDGAEGRWCVFGVGDVPTTLLALNNEGNPPYVPLAQAVHIAQLTNDAGEFWILYDTEPPPSSSSTPQWVQAYGRGADDACYAGWSASWQEWAVDVTGGLGLRRQRREVRQLAAIREPQDQRPGFRQIAIYSVLLSTSSHCH